MAAPTQQADLSFGLGSEDTNRFRIERFLDTTLEKTEEYAVMDWANNAKTVYVELKSRRINHNRYPTAIIGANKIAFCNDPTKEYYFCFSYLDGLYYIKYDAELFANFHRNDSYMRSDRPDCANNEQRIVYIPSELLRPFP